MILKIRRKMTHADSCRCVPTFLIIDNITSANFGEVEITRTPENMVILEDEHGKYDSFPCVDMVWEDSNQVGSRRFCRAILNISKTPDRVSNDVYYFNTEAFLMNDHGETIERLCP